MVTPSGAEFRCQHPRGTTTTDPGPRLIERSPVSSIVVNRVVPTRTWRSSSPAVWHSQGGCPTKQPMPQVELLKENSPIGLSGGPFTIARSVGSIDASASLLRSCTCIAHLLGHTL